MLRDAEHLQAGGHLGMVVRDSAAAVHTAFGDADADGFGDFSPAAVVEEQEAAEAEDVYVAAHAPAALAAATPAEPTSEGQLSAHAAGSAAARWELD